MEKKHKLLAGVVIAAIVTFGAWVFFKEGPTRPDDIRRFMMILCMGCSILSPLFSAANESPAAIKDFEITEEDQTAFHQVELGGKMEAAGSIMFGAAVIFILIMKSLDGFLAWLFSIAFFGGILLFILGVVLCAMGGSHMMKKAAEIETTQKSEWTESESKENQNLISKIIGVIGILSLIAWIVLLIFFR